MPHRFTDRWLASVTFGARWEEFTSLHHAADWLAAHGVRVSASTLYKAFQAQGAPAARRSISMSVIQSAVTRYWNTMLVVQL